MSYLSSRLYENKSYGYFVLGVLTTVYSFNFIDRQLLVILQESIKAEMGLSDTQLGLLSGFSFAIFYVSFGIPLAKLADTWIRRDVIAISLTIWSSMTAVSGFAQNFIHLLLARIGVAIGEAGGSPPAHAMVSDIFNQEQRATALAIYSTGINIGILFGFLLGGWINEFYGWRTAFLVVGLPGIALAIFLKLAVAEPDRGMAEEKIDDGSAPKLKETLKHLWSRKSFRHLSIACGIHAFVSYGAGYFSDKLGRQDPRWYQWVPAITTLIYLPFTLFIYLTDQTYLALMTTFITGMLFNAYLAPNLAITHSLVGLRMRAMSSAILFFILNFIGLGFGPMVIGFVSDMINPTYGIESIRYALLIVIPISTVWSATHYFIAAKHIRDDLELAPK